MSGSGRKSQYRKSVTSGFLDKKNADYLPSESEVIGKVKGNRGGSLFEVEIPIPHGEKPAATMEVVLAKLPNKFNKLIWIKANDYIVVEKDATVGGDGGGSSNFSDSGNSSASGYSIKEILSKENVRFLQRKTAWPTIFSDCQSDVERSKGANANSYGNDDIMPGYGEEEDDEYCCDVEDEQKEVTATKNSIA